MEEPVASSRFRRSGPSSATEKEEKADAFADYAVVQVPPSLSEGRSMFFFFHDVLMMF